MTTMESFVQAGNWGTTTRLAPEEILLPDPEPREQLHLIISVDDHLVEPPDTFAGRVPGRYADRAPRVIEDEDGRQYWLIDGGLEINVGGNAAAGRSPDASIGGESVRFDEMRRGAWDIDERIKDMDLNGIYASLSFPSTVFGFCGQRFLRMRDPKLGLACMRAYNDWISDVWAAPYPERIIPSQVTWLADPETAAQEIRRNAARGFKAVAFSENPQKLGLPSIHTGDWDPFLAACEETQTVVNLHVGSSSQVSFPSSDAPLDVMSALFSVNSILAAADWVYSKIPLRFPGLKIALSEGGVGWVPMLLDRLDFLAMFPRTTTWTEDIPPAEVLRRNFWFTTFWDPSAFSQRERIGVEHIMVEADYPHIDSTWPNTQAFIAEQLVGIPPDEARKITCENAAALYRHPLPG
jgi:predicted TIM-barrel fold metal-dependent hydrolase